jgi:hypothetical protein
MVSAENVVQINDRCNEIWDLNRAPDTGLVGFVKVYSLSRTQLRYR